MSKTIRSSHDVIRFLTTITMYSSLCKISSVLKEKKNHLGLLQTMKHGCSFGVLWSGISV